MKATLWEGGVRGVGFISSPLLKKQGYVSNHMIHVCDWLPTLYTAAGGDSSVMKNLDGYNIWENLSRNETGKRKEILHNIDPMGRFAGLRVGDYKILVGDVGMSWDDWYPPWQNPEDSVTLHVNNTRRKQVPEKLKIDFNLKTKRNTNENQKYIDDLFGGNLRFKMENAELERVLERKLSDTDNFLSNTLSSSAPSSLYPKFTPSSYSHNGEPVRVDCGPKPFNASTNCDPRVYPCLYHIPSDPCEYNNIAAENKDLVIQMLVRVDQYSMTMVPPLNTPVDPAGNPKYHNGTWVPWVKL